MDIQLTELSMKAKRALKEACHGHITLEGLSGLSKAKILRVHGIGRRTVKDIEEWLARNHK
jgi:hypothetical protein